MKEGNLIIWHESNDEIHFLLIKDDEKFNKYVKAEEKYLQDRQDWSKKLEEYNKQSRKFRKNNPVPEYPRFDEKWLEMIYENYKEDSWFTQTYCLEDMPFQDYKIKKVYYSGICGT